MTTNISARSLKTLFFLCVFMLPLGLSGCTGLFLSGANTKLPKAEPEEDEYRSHTKLVSDYTHPYGLDFIKVEAAAVVTGLDGTGEDPSPSNVRTAVLEDMQRRNIKSPGLLLASPDTTVVTVVGYLPPGIQAGDTFDVELRTPNRSKTKSLRNGYMLSCNLTEMRYLGDKVRKGHILAHSEGPILIDPSASVEEDSPATTRGRILGGGVATRSRDIGLFIDSQFKSARLAQQIETAINQRFYMYRHGQKKGIATAKTGQSIEIVIHPRYKHNVPRFVRVIRALAVRESMSNEYSRMLVLEKQLLNPLTTVKAALRLEAIGSEEAKEILKNGLNSEELEVRFAAAETLAYLDDSMAVKTLGLIAQDVPAYRVEALIALSAMDDIDSYDALRKLLSSNSAETRYGAFRALWKMNPNDPVIRGQRLNKGFGLHELDVLGDPMVHVTNSYRPEIVLFGRHQKLKLPLLLDAGKKILVNGMDGEEVVVSAYSLTGENEKKTVSNDLSEVIQAVVQLGGSYPDVVQMLQQAKRENVLEGRFRVDAIPTQGRKINKRSRTRLAMHTKLKSNETLTSQSKTLTKKESTPKSLLRKELAAKQTAEEKPAAKKNSVSTLPDLFSN